MTDHDFDELRLRADLRQLVEPASATLRARVTAIPEEVPASLDRRLPGGWRLPSLQLFAPVALAAAAAVVIVSVGIGLLVRPPEVGPSPVTVSPSAAPPSGSPSEPAASCAANPSPPVAAEGWTGPVRPPSATVTTMDYEGSAEYSIQDGDDSARGYVDLEQVRTQDPSQPDWILHVASVPPKLATLDPCTVLSYGLVFDTTGDGDADYVVGISTDVAEPATTREWVTNLATGETEENRTRSNKGRPFDFVWFGTGGPQGHRLVVTFLGSAPGGIDETTRFYAWASVEGNGQLVAWDYGPDAGWLQPSRHRD